MRRVSSPEILAGRLDPEPRQRAERSAVTNMRPANTVSISTVTMAELVYGEDNPSVMSTVRASRSSGRRFEAAPLGSRQCGVNAQ
jgi:hypothetical protein